MSTIPILYIIVFTHPYVAMIMLRLPESARKSPSTLRSFVRKMPPDTVLDMVRVNFLGLEKHNMVRLGSLRTRKPSMLRIENIISEGADKKFFGFGERFHTVNLPKER